MLTWSSDAEPVTVSVRFDRRSSYDARRTIWRVAISVEGTQVYEAADLETAEADACGALRSLGSFLGAWDEAQRYEGSENRSLFPESLLAAFPDWSTIADELSADLDPAPEGL